MTTNESANRGVQYCHPGQLNVKVSLEPALTDCLEKKSLTGNAYARLRLKKERQRRNEQHFQPLAGNEVLKGFYLKLTPMTVLYAPTKS
ncbi:hypothetical protein [Nostoc sp.]|uniref:hypothetical protein n=1 Tax=Nostoc sp. TaxID=1180 RepID=UPI002FF83BD9